MKEDGSEAGFHPSCTPEEITENRYHWDFDPSWHQGRGAYGGLIFGAMTHITAKHSPFPLRRLSAELCAPILSGGVELAIEEMRKGAATRFYQIRFTQGGKIAAFGSVTCGSVRNTDLDCRDEKAPDFPDWRERKPIFFSKGMPDFCRHFNYWPVLGFPHSMPKKLKTGGWVQAVKPGQHMTQELIAGLIDTWWPSIYLRAEKPRLMGTLSFAMDFMHPPLEDIGVDPCMLICETDTVHEGFALELNRLYDSNGRLLAQAQQLIAIID